MGPIVGRLTNTWTVLKEVGDRPVRDCSRRQALGGAIRLNIKVEKKRKKHTNFSVGPDKCSAKVGKGLVLRDQDVWVSGCLGGGYCIPLTDIRQGDSLSHFPRHQTSSRRILFPFPRQQHQTHAVWEINRRVTKTRTYSWHQPLCYSRVKLVGILNIQSKNVCSKPDV